MNSSSYDNDTIRAGGRSDSSSVSSDMNSGSLNTGNTNSNLLSNGYLPALNYPHPQRPAYPPSAQLCNNPQDRYIQYSLSGLPFQEQIMQYPQVSQQIQQMQTLQRVHDPLQHPRANLVRNNIHPQQMEFQGQSQENQMRQLQAQQQNIRRQQLQVQIYFCPIIQN